MTPERWQQVEDVLQAALDRPPEVRAAYLDEACAGDEELKKDAAELLAAHDEAGDFLEQPAIAEDAHVLLSDEGDMNIGRVIGPYRIVGRLGAGGMGEVYLAEDARLGRLVALKVLLAFFASDDARLRRFKREARAASALNHANILTIYEVGEADGVYFIATEFIDGRTLRELIAEGSLNLEEILDISVQLASALSAAHAAGIIHRDIKPENIMRRADGAVKILDFGIAKLTEAPSSGSSSEAPTIIKAQTETGVVMGTTAYMSPEQARGLPVDERTDIWSLGVVLYEMLAGRAPFAGATRMDTLVAVLEREPASLSQFEDAAVAGHARHLQPIIIEALSKDRDRRYRTVTELLGDLKRASREIALSPARPASATPASPPARSLIEQEARQAQRHILQALVVIILLAAVVFFYSRSATRRQSNEANATATAATTTTTKLYTQMSEPEKLAFIHEQEQRISAQMGERPTVLNEDALLAIKVGVDSYVKRLGSASGEPVGEDLRIVYARPAPYLPLIARAFAARKVPLMVGIYLPMIESEYRPCSVSQIGARGIFQFLPETARLYGVAPDEMCDAEKMTPAAAHYIADRMAELGDDSESMTLVLLSYNRGPEWVRDTLRRLRDEDSNYERNFWTLFVNRDQLDDTFRNENAYYVPRFFAAAIIGENPQAFGLQTPPLTTLATTTAPAKP